MIFLHGYIKCSDTTDITRIGEDEQTHKYFTSNYKTIKDALNKFNEMFVPLEQEKNYLIFENDESQLENYNSFKHFINGPLGIYTSIPKNVFPIFKDIEKYYKYPIIPQDFFEHGEKLFGRIKMLTKSSFLFDEFDKLSNVYKFLEISIFPDFMKYLKEFKTLIKNEERCNENILDKWSSLVFAYNIYKEFLFETIFLYNMLRENFKIFLDDYLHLNNYEEDSLYISAQKILNTKRKEKIISLWNKNKDEVGTKTKKFFVNLSEFNKSSAIRIDNDSLEEHISFLYEFSYVYSSLEISIKTLNEAKSHFVINEAENNDSFLAELDNDLLYLNESKNFLLSNEDNLATLNGIIDKVFIESEKNTSVLKTFFNEKYEEIKKSINDNSTAIEGFLSEDLDICPENATRIFSKIRNNQFNLNLLSKAKKEYYSIILNLIIMPCNVRKKAHNLILAEISTKYDMLEQSDQNKYPNLREIRRSQGHHQGIHWLEQFGDNSIDKEES